ncbi:GNAT family N-acetyltransferase [Bacillus sp. FJAT-27445]|uniref:GNAT family N-acetyltransferase n=1 Tax=Bacillus sp. FJAT-27445 TaxID=1679166 RepID=UPI00155F7D84|nr:GNAT family N-acetyltransferase [Bacillus sp. FJAT-27445]
MRKSLCALAETVFGINFEGWYKKGFWTEKYRPFSFCDGGTIIANVSVSKIGLVMNGELKDGLQIGTVMVHPDYRGKGLARKLMERVLKEYEGQYDVMYLFANQEVLDFYPKFGFAPVAEYVNSLPYSGKANNHNDVLQLNMENRKDREFLLNFAKQRIQVSSLFATEGTEELLMFYCMNVFSDSIYYLEDEECIAIYQESDGELQLFDLISRTKANLPSVLDKIAGEETVRIVFHFTPDSYGLPMVETPFLGSETMFVRKSERVNLPPKFKHPITSQA